MFDPAHPDTTLYGIPGAVVVGQDVNGAPMSPSAISTTHGSYAFSVRAPRNADGSPASGSVTLRADAAGYETFPSGLRVALPVALASATHANGRWIVRNALTSVGLTALASPPPGVIQGTVQSVPAGGALVVAECAGGADFSAVPGAGGGYVIFNVPAGTCSVTAYAKGVNYARVAGVTVPATTVPVTVDLARSAVPTATVTGSVSFVSRTDWPATSVLLVLDATYNSTTHRGLSPPGLRATNVQNAGAWSISGIPDGHYHALAAFETDYVVRDPSSIGGTAIPEFQVANGVPTLMDGTTSAATLPAFKVTGAVRLTEPFADPLGACTTLAALPADPGTLPLEPCASATTTPTFAWEVYPATDYYDLTVVDAVGFVVWEAHVAGGAGSIPYGATTADPDVQSTVVPAQPLVSGQMYQVRLVAIHVGGTPISTSEDLLGVFSIP